MGQNVVLLPLTNMTEVVSKVVLLACHKERIKATGSAVKDDDGT